MAETTARIKPPKRSRKKKYRDRKKAKKAALLSVTDIDGGTSQIFEVSGGSEPRTVRIKDNGSFDCTCHNASSPCSHVLAVQLFIRRRDAGNGKEKRRD